RRTFLAYSLAAGWAASRAFADSSAPGSNPVLPAVNAISPLKKKLVDGQSVTLLIISDSTGYKDTSGTRRFIRWLASQYPTHAALGPKDFPSGRGSILAPIGRVALEFPHTPQAAIIQNPWRDNEGYERVRDWWLAAAQTMPALTLIDGYSPFIAQKKSPDLYQ